MSAARRILSALRPIDHSGPVVARLFHRLLAVVFLIAWLSITVQLPVLIGSHGLMPIAAFLDRARGQLSFAELPTIFWLGAGDRALTAGAILGIILSIVAFAGVAPRAIAAVQVALYLSYVTAARTFLAFQWDALIIECGFFSIFLPRARPAWWIHTVFRLILFKLYWESGIAKWQSQLGDWRDGSAMSYYYETAPLPTALAWYMHHLPAWWHALESWATLVLELVVPLGVFVGARRVRLTCAAALTGFQIVNAATANYGFFCYLALVLHVFFFDDTDLARAAAWMRAHLRRRSRPSLAAPAPALGPRPAPTPSPAATWRTRSRRLLARTLVTIFIAVSTIDALIAFSHHERLQAALWPIARVYAPWHIINTYHLFASITRERIEPDFQTTDDGEHWTARDFHHKPGDPHRRPDWVAPHQPRVDFRLWFYGLSFRQGAPELVAVLIDRLCHETVAVQPLFRERLFAAPARGTYRLLAIPFFDGKRTPRAGCLVDARPDLAVRAHRLRHRFPRRHWRRRLVINVREVAFAGAHLQ